MLYVLQTFWLWFVLALIIGMIVGWLTWSNTPRESWFAGWVIWGVLALAIGLVLAVTTVVPGRAGLWLETGLISVAFYIVGCLVGGWFRRSVTFNDGMPQRSPRVAGEDKHKGTRPAGFVSPRGGRGDDLKLIKGVERFNEKRLHKLGIWHFDQIANWTKADVTWVGSYLSFPGRIQREKWVAQCKRLAAGGASQDRKYARTGRATSSRRGKKTRPRRK